MTVDKKSESAFDRCGERKFRTVCASAPENSVSVYGRFRGPTEIGGASSNRSFLKNF
jgi:hypothetical protein